MSKTRLNKLPNIAGGAGFWYEVECALKREVEGEIPNREEWIKGFIEKFGNRIVSNKEIFGEQS